MNRPLRTVGTRSSGIREHSVSIGPTAEGLPRREGPLTCAFMVGCRSNANVLVRAGAFDFGPRRFPR
jgi:hypothetical protein